MPGCANSAASPKQNWPKAGLPQPQLAQLEQRKHLSPDTLLPLAQALGVTTGFIQKFDPQEALALLHRENLCCVYTSHALPTLPPPCPFDEVIRLFGQVLQNEQTKVSLLTTACQAMQILTEHVSALKNAQQGNSSA